MIAGVAAVVLASVVGSLHCVAMCGPLMALHLRAPGARRDVVLHHVGRATGYAALGALAGGLGQLVDLAGAALAVQRAALWIAALGLAGSGLVLAIRALRQQAARAAQEEGRTQPPPARAVSSGPRTAGSPSLFARGLVQLRVPRAGGKAGRPRSAAPRAFAMGLLHALLPCGWLWAFVALAAGTGAPLTGAVTMVAFWLGTLPALVGVTALAAPLVARLRLRWPLVTAALMLGLAGTVLLLRFPMIAPRDAGHPAPSCHSPSHPLPSLEQSTP